MRGARVCRRPIRLVACLTLLVFSAALPRRAAAQDVAVPELIPHPPRVIAASAVQSAASDAFDATYYHLTLDVFFEPDLLVGQTRVEGRVASGSLDTLVLDLMRNMQVVSVRSADGADLPFVHTGDALHIDLPGAPTAPASVAVDIAYQGVPGHPSDPAFLMGRRENGDRFVWTLSEPYGARQWWPSKDHPSDKADSVRVTVSVPDPLAVASQGLLRTEPVSENGRTTFDWFSRYPISTYLVSIAGGVYDYHRQIYERPPDLESEFGPLSLPVVHYEYADDVNFFVGQNPNVGWHFVLDVFPVFESWFGPYPFSEEKYGHAQFTWGGGMEHQTISSMGGSGVALVAHELAHQWYGDLITLQTWPHLWLNEGFASYATILFFEEKNHLFTNDPYRQVFDIEYGRARFASGTLIVQDTTSFSSLFDATRVYAKGAMVLHMLRGVVGDDTFREILRTYAGTESLRYANATTSDFVEIAETVSGMDLSTFFRQWVTEGTGFPVYEVTWDYVPLDDSFEVQVDVHQVQDPPASNVEVFEMPLTFAVEDAEATRRFTVSNYQRSQQYRFQVPLEPIGLELDPDRDVLRDVDVQLVGTESRPGTGQAVGLEAVYPNPASDVIHIRLSAAPRSTHPPELVLYDALGRQVRRIARTASGTTVTVPVADLAAGTYFLRLRNEGSDVIRAVTVQR